jgi:hypothetical protein
LWAQIDGQYPIHITGQEGCSFSELPMVYPMPPNTTNIHVYLGDREVEWSNYTQAYPGELHHTAIGDWWMIYAPLTDLSDDFTLRIHYEHPLETANSSYLFLYDLNISPYLSEQSQNSTAIFAVHFNTNVTELQVYTAPPDSPPSQWQPKTYTATTQGASKIVTIDMDSDYGTQLVGDLVVEFSSLDGVPEFSVWVVFGLLAAGICAGLLYHRRQKLT